MNEYTSEIMTMEEMIDTLKGLVFNSFDRTTVKERQALDMAIKALYEEVKPIVRWKCSIAYGMYENRIWCNNCGFIKVITGEEENYNFCPKCGAIVEKQR